MFSGKKKGVSLKKSENIVLKLIRSLLADSEIRWFNIQRAYEKRKHGRNAFTISDPRMKSTIQEQTMSEQNGETIG